MATGSGSQAGASAQLSLPGPWVTMSPGVRRRVLAVGTAMMVQEVEFQDGAAVDPHAHPHEQATYVVRGALRFRLGEREMLLEAGQTVVVPGRTVHGCRAVGPTLVVDVFHPLREEYLAELRR